MYHFPAGIAFWGCSGSCSDWSWARCNGNGTYLYSLHSCGISCLLNNCFFSLLLGGLRIAPGRSAWGWKCSPISQFPVRWMSARWVLPTFLREGFWPELPTINQFLCMRAQFWSPALLCIMRSWYVDGPDFLRNKLAPNSRQNCSCGIGKLSFMWHV